MRGLPALFGVQRLKGRDSSPCQFLNPMDPLGAGCPDSCNYRGMVEIPPPNCYSLLNYNRLGLCVMDVGDFYFLLGLLFFAVTFGYGLMLVVTRKGRRKHGAYIILASIVLTPVLLVIAVSIGSDERNNPSRKIETATVSEPARATPKREFDTTDPKRSQIRPVAEQSTPEAQIKGVGTSTQRVLSDPHPPIRKQAKPVARPKRLAKKSKATNAASVESVREELAARCKREIANFAYTAVQIVNTHTAEGSGGFYSIRGNFRATSVVGPVLRAFNCASNFPASKTSVTHWATTEAEVQATIRKEEAFKQRQKPLADKPNLFAIHRQTTVCPQKEQQAEWTKQMSLENYGFVHSSHCFEMQQGELVERLRHETFTYGEYSLTFYEVRMGDGQTAWVLDGEMEKLDR